MKKILAFVFVLSSLFLPSLASAATITSSPDVPVELNLSALSGNYRHQISITRIVTPKKMTGNPFRDSYLQARCGDHVLATDSRRIAPSDFGKAIVFAMNFELATEFCSSFVLAVELQTNGITIESPSLDYSNTVIAETSEYFISRSKSEMTSKQQDLVFYHGELSKASGNRQSLHCLIKTYEVDPSFDSLVTDLKGEYRKLFAVDYVASDISCPYVADLDAAIESCGSASPQRTFCAFYTLYSQTLEWFRETVQKAQFQKTLLREGDVIRLDALNSLIAEIENTKNASLEQIKGGAGL